MNTTADKLLELVRTQGLVRPNDLAPLGIPRVALTRAVQRGQLERVGRGLYGLTARPVSAHGTLAEVARRVPKGVVCLLSALRFHDLTTQAPFEVWLAIDNKAATPKLDYPPLRLVRFSGAALTEGVEEHVVDGVTVRVTGVAKTVALDGLMMGTRTGALDPGAVLYLMEIEKLSLEQVGRVLYHESGLLGVSGISAEPRVIVGHENDAGETGERARLALALYVRRIVREIGALVAVLGGLDMLVFTAGVGEHNAFIRERICAALGFLGIALDTDANASHAATISSDHSQVTVAVEPTNEEWIAASHALSCLDREKAR